ncbi:hypothetical protein D0Y65_051095 [Glycine soja]|uniref:HAT C-terminal dimerisation domain-containing protein n=1 Tax=Glycine soja TaxID=3848 RepID=A0A445FEP4_GLYSO|nr:hypothetical protein D0Y65_051095 [Glycine soja]
MLKRFKQLKKGLQEMVISDQWSSYKEDDVAKAKFVKDTLLDDKWWDKVDYILSFTSPIYDVLRRTDTEASSLHLVYEMWDSMIEKVKNAIYQYERKEESEGSTFYEVVHSILIDRWTKSSTPLHCLAHSLNPRYYSHEWLSEDSNRVPPHQDLELTRERLKCFKRFFLDMDVRRKVNIEFANFSDGREGFDDLNSLNDRGQMDPKAWWLVHGINAPILQKVALKLLAQPCSSSCCERNWSTYSFIHSLKRNKMAPHRAEDLVFVHSNLRLLSRNTPQYHQEETKMWDVAGDDFGSLNDCGRLLFSPPQSLKSPSSQTPQSIFCCVFPSFNPIDVPKQPSITNVPCAEHNQLDVIRLSQQSQLSSSERKLMSRAQRQRQLAFAAQKQLLNDLETSKPHEHESMKEAAQDTFAILNNLGANDTQFFEHVLDFIKLTSSVVQMTKSIECLEEDNKRLEDENAKLAHIRDLYAKTEDQFQASDQRRQLLSKEISDFEAMLVEKRNQLKSCELETSNMRIELGGLRRTMLEADTALKARMKQAEIAGKLRKEREAKQIAAKTALEKARLKSEY